MKTIRHISLLAALTVAAACSLEETTVPQEGKTLLRAGIAHTKTNATDDGVVTWSTGDAISVFNGDHFLSFSLADGAGTAQGTFAGALMPGEKISGFAVYPDGAAQYQDGTLSITWPAERTLGGTNCPAPMLARIADEESPIQFEHLGGVLKLSYEQIPETADGVYFTAPGKRVTGSFTLNLDEATPEVKAEETEGQQDTLTVRFPAGNSRIDLMIPLPTASYDEFTVGLLAGNEVLDIRTARNAANVIRRADLLLMPQLTLTLLDNMTAVPFFSDVRLTWDKDPDADAYKIICNGVETMVDSTSHPEEGDYAHISAHLTGLSKGTAYDARIAPVRDGIVGSYTTAKFLTGDIWQHSAATAGREINAGPTQVCIKWDDMSGGSGGSTRGYQFELYDGETASTPILSMYSYNGVTEAGGALGGSGYLGKYLKTETATSGSNFLIPAGVSLGYLKPATNYWFRLKTIAPTDLSEYNSATSASFTLSAQRGESEWSERVPVTTPAAHTPAAKELFFEGFDDLCFNADFVNTEPGLLQRTPGHVPAGAEDFGTMITQEKWGITTYSTQWPFHNTHFGMSEPVPDEETWTYPNNQSVTSINTAVRYKSTGKVLKDWKFTNSVYPAMGTLRMGGASSAVTPPLEDNLSMNGTVCRISLKSTVSSVKSPKKLEVMVLHEGISEAVSAFSVQMEQNRVAPVKNVKPFPYDNYFGIDGFVPPVSDYIFETNFWTVYRWQDIEGEVVLYPGDRLVIYAPTACFIDDIRLIKDRDLPGPSLLVQDPTQLGVTWSFYDDAELDIKDDYTFSLYSDNSFEDGSLVARFTSTAPKFNWKWNHALTPRCMFNGLTPATRYWFEVIDESTGKTMREVFTTADDPGIVTAETATGEAGSVALYEDFRELVWFAYDPHRIPGVYPTEFADKAFTAARGDCTTGWSTFLTAQTGWSLFGTLYENATSKTRLANWAQYNASDNLKVSRGDFINAGSGMVRVGVSDPAVATYGQAQWNYGMLVTEPLKLKGPAKIRVTVSAVPYHASTVDWGSTSGSDNRNGQMGVFNGADILPVLHSDNNSAPQILATENGTHNWIQSAPDQVWDFTYDTTYQFSEYTHEFEHVPNGARIGFGARPADSEKATGSYHRIDIDWIRIEIISYD